MHTLHLPTSLRARLLKLAEAQPQEEICGLITGHANQACRFYPINNVATDKRTRFAMDAHRQIQAMCQARELGETLLAIYHSHPQGPSQPSARDIEELEYTQTLQLIISFDASHQACMRGFLIEAGVARELPLKD